MNKLKQRLGQVSIVLAGAFSLAGCINDAAYNIDNFNNVDESVYLFTNGLSFPLGKTEPLTMGGILKMTEVAELDSILKKDQFGNYSLAVEGKNNLDEMIAEFHIEELNNFKGINFSREIKHHIGDTSGISYYIQEFSTPLDFEEKDVVFFDSQTMSSFPEELKAIDEMVLDKVNALIDVKIIGLPDIPGAKFYLKNTKLEMPSFLYGENDDNVLIFNDEIEIFNGIMTLQSAVLTKIKDIQIAGATETKGDVKFYSTLYADNFNVDISKISADIKFSLKVGIGNGLLPSLPGKITISKAIAKVDYEMEQKMAVEFGEVPASLQADSVNFALNPEMHIELATNFGAPIKGDLVLTPFIGGQPVENVTIKGVQMPCSDDWTKKKTNKYAIGANVSAASEEEKIQTDLSPLLKRIPDSIVVSINSGIDEKDQCYLFPAARYTCDMNYDFVVPISFGKDFKLNFQSEIEVEEGSDDIFKMTKIFKLKGAYKTTLPIGVTATVVLLDENDREIELDQPAGFELTPSEDGQLVKYGDIDLVISMKDPASVHLRKIRFNYKIKASAGVNIKENQYIQIENLQAILPNGLYINVPEE